MFESEPFAAVRIATEMGCFRDDKLDTATSAGLLVTTNRQLTNNVT